MADKDALELLQGALNYIKHVGANQTMRGQQHPQQWLVDGLEHLLCAEEAKKAEGQVARLPQTASSAREAGESADPGIGTQTAPAPSTPDIERAK